MKIALFSPYHGGSHQAWGEGYRASSSHDVRLWTLPARFWKWRMHGGAVTLARLFAAETGYSPDLVLATDMLDLTTFLALSRHQTGMVPTALYMHENQLTYPLPEDGSTGPMRRQLGERDRHYAFINYASMLAADLVLFNSRYHLDSLFGEFPQFLRHFPEYNELDSIESLKKKSDVLAVGIDLQRFSSHSPGGATNGSIDPNFDAPPLIIWNQRWEYDKNPTQFFDALYVIQEEGIPFRLVLCGQQFSQQPAVFDEAISRLADHIIHAGFASQEEYKHWLTEASITISTASHEFFGISVVEAISCQTFPILPGRLSYPEIIPDQYHLRCLYRNQQGLLQRLRWALDHREEANLIASKLASVVQKYDWSNLANTYDSVLERLV